MDKNEVEIMVVPREILFADNKHFQGFKGHDEHDFQQTILDNHRFEKRGPMEEDESFKQPIGYVLIVNPKLRKVFAYRRSDSGGEGRLHGNWSWGVGGHIEKADSEGENPIRESLAREILEEVELSGGLSGIKPLGYINYDNNSVSKVHFGILYVIETDSSEVRPKDIEVGEGRLLSIEEIEGILSKTNVVVEEWSKIALEPLKTYFNEL